MKNFLFSAVVVVVFVGTLTANAMVIGPSASLVLGQPDFTSGAPNSEGLSASSLSFPNGLSFDYAGNLWVADGANNRVLMFPASFSNYEPATLVLGQSSFTTNGANSGGLSAGSLNFPASPVLDSPGNLWVTDAGNNRVLMFEPPFTNGMSASLVLGQPDFTSGAPNNGGLSASSLHTGGTVAFDSQGSLWTTDALNNRVLMFSPPFSNGQAASLVLGQPDFVSNSPGTSATSLNTGLGPSDLAFDSSGNLWVADSGNNRVLMFSPPFTDGQASSIVLGQQDFTSNTPGTSSTRLNVPNSVRSDSRGSLWVSDRDNNRVLTFSHPFINGQAAGFVLGQQDFASNAPGTTASTFNLPNDVEFDSSGNLWIEDRGNNRVLEFRPSPLVGGVVDYSPDMLTLIGTYSILGVVTVSLVAIAYARRRRPLEKRRVSPF